MHYYSPAASTQSTFKSTAVLIFVYLIRPSAKLPSTIDIDVNADAGRPRCRWQQWFMNTEFRQNAELPNIFRSDAGLDMQRRCGSDVFVVLSQ